MDFKAQFRGFRVFGRIIERFFDGHEQAAPQG